MNDLPPETGGVQYIGFINGGEFFAPLPGGLEGDLGDAADLQLAVGLGVIGLGAVFALTVAALAEVDAACELPDHHQVKALFGGAFPQGALRAQGLVQPGGAKVGIQAQHRAQLQQRLLRPDIAGQTVPLGPANSAQQHAVRGQTAVYGLLGQGLAAGIDGAAAGKIGLATEDVAELAAHFLQNADGIVHDLGTDAIAFYQSNVEFHGK